MASHQQGITQFKILTSNPSASSSSPTLVTTGVNPQSQQPSNIILQSSSSPQQASTIRKVGSSGSLSSLQKVQAINNIKQKIKILTNPVQRVTTKTTTISTTNQTPNTQSIPAQYQQVFQTTNYQAQPAKVIWLIFFIISFFILHTFLSYTLKDLCQLYLLSFCYLSTYRYGGKNG